MKLVFCSSILGFAITASAQTSRGTITGTVLDSSGATVAGAHITLKGVTTGARLSTTSNDAGVCRFDAVDLGNYDLYVRHPEFRQFTARGIGVEANRVTTFDPRLEVGATESSIEVNAGSSDVLIKDSPLRGGNFQSREIRDLPLVSSNPLSLARTLPGVTDAQGSRVWTSTSNSGGGFSINGQRPRANNYLLDDCSEMQKPCGAADIRSATTPSLRKRSFSAQPLRRRMRYL